MPCKSPATGTEAGRSTDFNILVHLDRIGDSRLTPRYAPWFHSGSSHEDMWKTEAGDQGPVRRS